MQIKRLWMFVFFWALAGLAPLAVSAMDVKGLDAKAIGKADGTPGESHATASRGSSAR